MITTEMEIRVALQAVLAAVLALYGFWGCAAVLFLLLLPWKPLLTAGVYLTQPIVDWRRSKTEASRGKSLGQVEKELAGWMSRPDRHARSASAAKTAEEISTEPAPPSLPPTPAVQAMSDAEAKLAAAMAISPAIKHHVCNLPHGVFRNMHLEVEDVKFHGDFAEANVKFRSPNVSELVIRQRYLLRKAGEQWQVQSRQPANGNGNGNGHGNGKATLTTITTAGAEWSMLG